MPYLIDISYMFLPTAVDPTSLCPFCDEPYPDDPSKVLQDMMTKARSRAYRDCRPSNTLGLKAELLYYFSMCRRHRFETGVLPKAKHYGWPTCINFDELPTRVEALRNHLAALIENKELSVFWQDLKCEIKNEGLSKVISIEGQMKSFDKSMSG